MNNLVSTEKSLKRWLKSRVKITMATVVGFLIAGTVVFAEEEPGKKPEYDERGAVYTQSTIIKSVMENEQKDYLEVTSVKEQIEGKEFQVAQLKVNGSGDAIASAKDDAYIDFTAYKENDTIKKYVSVDDNDNVTLKDGTVLFVGGKSGKGQGQAIIGLYAKENTTATNEGLLVVAGDDSVGMYGQENEVGAQSVTVNDKSALLSKAVKATVINKGDMRVEGKNAKGFNVGAGTTAINEGTIVVDVTTEAKDGDVAFGMRAYAQPIVEKVEATDPDNGTEQVTETEDEYKVRSAEEIKTVLTNKNLIDVVNGTGMSIAAVGDYIKASNEGTIKVAENGIGVEVREYKGLLNKDGATTTTFLNKAGATIDVQGGTGAKLIANSVLNNEGTIDIAEGAIGVSLVDGAKFINGENGKMIIATGATGINVESAGGESLGEEPLTRVAENNGVITLLDTTFTQNGLNGEVVLDGTEGDGGEAKDETTSILLSGKGEFVNYGTIALNDREETELKDADWNALLGKIVTDGGKLANYGVITNSNGHYLIAGGDKFEGGSVEDIVDGTGFENGIKVEGNNITLAGSENKAIENNTINVIGEDTKLILNGTVNEVVMKDIKLNITDNALVAVKGTDNKITGNINLSGSSILRVNQNSDLTLSGSVTKGEPEEGKNGTILNNGTLNLSDVAVGVDITSTDNSGYKGSVESSGNTSVGNIQAKEITVNDGITTFGGAIDSTNINIGKIAGGHAIDVDGTTMTEGYFKADANFKKEGGSTVTVTDDSVAVFEIGLDGSNALANSAVKVTVTGNIDFDVDTQTLTENTSIDLNNKNNENDLSGAIYVNENNQKDNVYKISLNDNNTLGLAYNKELFAEYGNALNEMNNSLQGANDKFSQNKGQRANQMDNLYAANIYSETARVALDNVRLSEDAILAMNNNIKAGEWTANGSVIYSNAEHDREGAVNTYTAETESTGLLAAMEYGITDTSAVGFAFSGTKQDVDLGMSNADGDAFYFGLYGRKAVGAYDFTAGLGYQLNKFDADNGVFRTSADYDSDVFSGYVQGKYRVEVKDGLTLAPKARLGFAFLEQESVNDSVYRADKQDLSTYNAELGLDLIKTVQLDKGNLDFMAGVSYVRTMGDTDDMTTGEVLNQKGSYTEIDVFGAELAENVVKFNLGAEMTQENGFFYNGGFTYKFGTDENSAYSVNAGVGYKF